MTKITIDDLAAMMQEHFATKEDLKATESGILRRVDDRFDEIVAMLRLIPTRDELVHYSELAGRVKHLETQMRTIKRAA